MPHMVGRNMDVVCIPSEWSTMAEMCLKVTAKRGNVRVFSWRPVVEVKQRQVGRPKEGEKPQMISVTVFGQTQHLTYRQFRDKVLAVAAGLRWVGLQPGDILAVYEDTRFEWQLVSHAAWQQAITIATVYANLGDDALAYALNQTEAKVVFTNAKNVKKLLTSSTLTALTTVVYTDTLSDSPQVDHKQAFSLADLEERGRREPMASVLPKPSDLACIMYTSGTTGDPKGVMMTHRNMVAAVYNMFNRIKVVPGSDDFQGCSFLAYLPLAHVLELVAENTWLAGGGLLQFGTPRTLTDSAAEPHGDLREFNPAVMCGVPRVFDTVKKTMESQLSSKPELVRILFATAFKCRKQAIAAGRDTPLWRLLVFRKLAAVFGNGLRILISGGAPLNANTHEFMRVAVGVPVVQGYGLTETCACLSLQHYGDDSCGNVGAVHEVCEVKLVDIPEMGYTSTDPVGPRGEICIRGPAVSQGYYKLPEKTAEDFSTDGWFATGDIGLWTSDGALRIIDRKKNLVKLAMGEYVALERLESVYGNCPFVQPNGICCVADPDMSFVVALILVSRDAVMRVVTAKGWAGDFHALLQTTEVKRAVEEALAKEAKQGNLKPFEQVKRFRLYTDEWTAENGMLTAAMKLLRRNVQEHYKADIAAMYSDA
eukprot:GGOE01019399.1.p1 GENE.GGOE01019399.1~~GGOE01019399.1.p1  ORF type:complete len:720 (+),score=233.59 GGOE01019399.1:205-2160(+)